MEQKRKLKVYTRYSKKSERFIPNPEIRLTGKWVREWGFKCGNKITVKRIENGVILINERTNDLPTIYL